MLAMLEQQPILARESMEAPPSPSVERMRRALSQSPYRSLRALVCDGDRGVLILRGRVPSFYLRQLAQALALKLDGVEAIIDRIEVTAVSSTGRRPR